jgi:hypothetical protein
MSINPDFVAEYWMNFVTHSCDPNISIVVYDEAGNILPSRPDAATYALGDRLQQTKQLLTNFVYNEPWSSGSIAVDHLFKITPDGLPGAEPITIIVDPVNVVLKSNENGDVLPGGFTPSITSIKVKQGDTFLIFDTASVLPAVGGAGNFNTDGLFSIINVSGSNVGAGVPNSTRLIVLLLWQKVS